MGGSMVFAFDKNREKILLVKRRDIPVWVLPGGGIEKGETDEEAAVRETKEESGYDIKIIRKVAEYIHKGSGKKNNLFEAVVIGGMAETNKEASAIDFFYPDKMPELRHPLIDEWIVDLNKKSKEVIKRKIQGVTIKQSLRQVHKHPLLVVRFLLTRIGIHINI